ncbi:altronate dehydratase [Clostridium sp. MCC353]|uniref:UxaA family hydrolase n=1 Tax=Clostridium sp. MCC353 TaxID=2592646 RepID=UPI001C01CFB4|nr:altronate dehydratase family protein [Clostridium sp. MCC353]MBT9777416.1 altronate dehydratase [Clostridium sp. MCC353]
MRSEITISSETLLKIGPKDNVAVALVDLYPNHRYKTAGREICVSSAIPKAHKVALVRIEKGENAVKYGAPIGVATETIAPGDHVHSHNLRTGLDGILEYRYTPDAALRELLTETSGPAGICNLSGQFGIADQSHTSGIPDTFDGYLRPDGRAGTRNEVWIIPTVGCVNRTVRILEERARKLYGNRIDGIFSFPHNSGCSQLGEDHLTTQKLLRGLIRHPNAGAVLVVSLGCENNNLENFLPVLGNFNPERVKFLVTQNCDDEYEEGLKLLDQLTGFASRTGRTPLPLSKLQLGFKCGSSDAFSGVSANPLCGQIADLVIQKGGTCILTEVPEMFGAEQELMNRAVSEEVFHKIVSLVNGFKSYFKRYNQPIYENPCPGNKKGGITTLEEKSLGCIQKGGCSPVTDVLSYGDYPLCAGLNLLNGPGNDAVSCTNLTASGCNIILFTTGGGNPFGAPAPTVKISSNSALADHKQGWIDFNAGPLLEGSSFEQERELLFRQLIKTASGQIQTKSELYGYRDISIFKDGILM